jgi:hypothetical protein
VNAISRATCSDQSQDELSGLRDPVQVDVDTKDISNDVTEKKINKIKKAVKQIYSCNSRTLNILS